MPAPEPASPAPGAGWVAGEFVGYEDEADLEEALQDLDQLEDVDGEAALAWVREDRLLLETDAPDLAPDGVDGLNEPAHLARIAETADRIRPGAAVAAWTNARRLFGPGQAV